MFLKETYRKHITQILKLFESLIRCQNKFLYI